MCKEYESPTRTLYAAVNKQVFDNLVKAVPDLWRNDIAIWCDVDVNDGKMYIEMDLVPYNTGVSYTIRDIVEKKVRGDDQAIMAELRQIVHEFEERTFIRMNRI